MCSALSALMLLVEQQEGHLACNATATHCLLLRLNPDWFYLSDTWVVLDNGPLNGCVLNFSYYYYYCCMLEYSSVILLHSICIFVHALVHLAYLQTTKKTKCYQQIHYCSKVSLPTATNLGREKT